MHFMKQHQQFRKRKIVKRLCFVPSSVALWKTPCWCKHSKEPEALKELVFAFMRLV